MNNAQHIILELGIKRGLENNNYKAVEPDFLAFLIREDENARNDVFKKL